jgi:hypothetical protein
MLFQKIRKTTVVEAEMGKFVTGTLAASNGREP